MRPCGKIGSYCEPDYEIIQYLCDFAVYYIHIANVFYRKYSDTPQESKQYMDYVTGTIG